MLDREAQAPRRRRPGPHRTPVLLVHQTRPVPAHVHPRQHLDARVVLVVVRLDRGEVGEVPLPDGPQRDPRRSAAGGRTAARSRPRLVGQRGQRPRWTTEAPSRTAWSSTARRGSGTASHGSTRTRPGAPAAGRRAPLDGGRSPPHTSASSRPVEDPVRVLGGRLVGLPRLVVAAPGEPLLALPAGLGAALHVPLPDLGLRDGRPARRSRRRSRPCAPAARPTGPGRSTARAKAAASAGPSYAAPKGSARHGGRAVGGGGAQRTGAHDVRDGCRAGSSKLSNQRTTRSGGTSTVRRHGHSELRR